MNKISVRVEEIFAQAVALDQAGRMKNTIYAIGNEVFVLNYDHTILLRFMLRKTEAPFNSPISFRANDYDSRQFYEEDGKIIFVTEDGGFTRKKSCATPGRTPEEVKELFNSFAICRDNKVQFSKDVLKLLEEDLSHIEFSAVNGSPVLIQRNIYNGSVIELTRNEAKSGLGIGTNVAIESDFGPIGMRTNDFAALFAFQEHIDMCFPSGAADYCYVESRSPRMKMDGFVSHCVYDELGGVTESQKGEENGRKEQEKRGSKQGANRPAKSKSTRRTGAKK